MYLVNQKGLTRAIESSYTGSFHQNVVMRSSTIRLAKGAFSNVQARSYSAEAGKIRHFMSIKDLTRDEFATLVRNAAIHKKAAKAGNFSLSSSLAGRTVPMMFSKRSTRTRVSTEGAVTLMGGNPMFLGKDDIQLGVWAAPSFP